MVHYRMVDTNARPIVETTDLAELMNAWKGAPEGVCLEALFEGFEEYHPLRPQDCFELLDRGYKNAP